MVLVFFYIIGQFLSVGIMPPHQCVHASHWHYCYKLLVSIMLAVFVVALL